MEHIRLFPLTAAVAAAAVALGGCGGSSGPSANQQAITLMHQQTLPLDNGGQLAPSKVTCNTAGTSCTITFPNGQVQDCSVSISGSNSNVGCSTRP